MRLIRLLSKTIKGSFGFSATVVDIDNFWLLLYLAVIFSIGSMITRVNKVWVKVLLFIIVGLSTIVLSYVIT
ncbi:hypothetical protein KK437_17015 [Clostridioides difficile]|nr:hypothetical protein [Clostridioides difficile]